MVDPSVSESIPAATSFTSTGDTTAGMSVTTFGEKRRRLSTPLSKRPSSATAPREETVTEVPTKSLGSTNAAADRPSPPECALTGSPVTGHLAAGSIPSGLSIQRPLSSAVTLCLRGLNIQWPFSQLILREWKTIEARGYVLGHRQIASADTETWIVETRGPSSRAETNALVGGIAIAPRPETAQVVLSLIHI